MRESELFGGESGGADEEEIDIDGAGGVECASCFGFAAEFVLDGLGFEKKLCGGEVTFEGENGVEEGGGIWRAVERVGLVDGRGYYLFGSQGLEEFACLSKVGQSVTKIRAKRKVDHKERGFLSCWGLVGEFGAWLFKPLGFGVLC